MKPHWNSVEIGIYVYMHGLIHAGSSMQFVRMLFVRMIFIAAISCQLGFFVKRRDERNICSALWTHSYEPEKLISAEVKKSTLQCNASQKPSSSARMPVTASMASISQSKNRDDSKNDRTSSRAL